MLCASSMRLLLPQLMQRIAARLFLFGLAFAGGLLPAQDSARRGNIALRVAADRADAIYRAGETVTFEIDARSEGLGTVQGEVRWLLTKDGGAVLQEGSSTLHEGRARATGTLDEPGFLQCRVTREEDGKSVSALGAAGVDPLGIKPSLPVP